MDGSLQIRTYEETDWSAIEAVHDRARKIELHLAGLEEAFLPLAIAAKREGLLDYPGLYVAEWDRKVVGFTACTDRELAWLYVDPAYRRRGVGRKLSEYALEKHPQIDTIETLKGNESARKLYESLGFQVEGVESGQMPGNEAFHVEVYCLCRHLYEGRDER